MTRRVFMDALVRWRAGRIMHGNAGWVGRPPLEEAYEELLDSINYFREHGRVHPEDAEWAEHMALRSALGAACVLQKIEG